MRAEDLRWCVRARIYITAHSAVLRGWMALNGLPTRGGLDFFPKKRMKVILARTGATVASDATLFYLSPFSE